MTHFVENYGLWVVFVVVTIEVAGLPFIPGETALITAAVLASQGTGSIVWTIVLAVAAAVAGASIGYAIGRVWGRELLALWPWFERLTAPGVARSDAFFARHGAKAVVLGRFLPLVRSTLGWMAGVGRMGLPRFLAANVAGAVAWGLGIGLAAYYAGATVIDTIQHDAAVGVGILIILVLAAYGVHRVQHRMR